MSDYSQVNDYSDKDALSTGNPLKLIKGSDIDAELAAVSVAVASKYDSTDIATAGEAQAGVSNTVIITPARLTAWGQNDAGVIEDLQALSDPTEDRVLFWDNSASTTTWLTMGTGLTLTDTTLAVGQVLTGIGLAGGGNLDSDLTLTLDWTDVPVLTAVADADYLIFSDTDDSNNMKAITFSNFESTLLVANMIDGVDMTGVVLTAGEGLSYSVGGTDMSASATIDLDIDELTVETTIDAANDRVVFYDNSAAAHRKVAIDALVGTELGDGLWNLAAATNVTSTEATLIYDTESFDSLTRGTFSTSTGLYTAGADGARILVSATAYISSQGEGEDAHIRIQVAGSTRAQTLVTNRGQYGASSSTMTATGVMALTAGQQMRVRVQNDATRALSTGYNTTLSIVELA